MKTIKIKTYALILALSVLTTTFWSCENPIEFDGEQMESLMVMNSLISPDSIFTVQLTKSKFFLKDDSSFDLLNNANVKLFVNDTLFETLAFSENGNYSASYIPKIGDNVKLTAEYSGLTAVSAVTSILKPAQISSIDTATIITDTYPILSYQYGGYYGEVTDADTIGYTQNRKMNIIINIDDDVNLKNYYRVSVRIKRYFDDGRITDNEYYYQSDDMVFGSSDESGVFGEGYSRSIYNEFSDDLFNGKNYPFKLSAYFNTYTYNTEKKPDEQGGVEWPEVVRSELIVQVHSISESYYKYVKTVNTNSNALAFFSEPVQIYSNVKGGIGVFGNYKIDNYIIQIPVSYTDNYPTFSPKLQTKSSTSPQP